MIRILKERKINNYDNCEIVFGVKNYGSKIQAENFGERYM